MSRRTFASSGDGAPWRATAVARLGVVRRPWTPPVLRASATFLLL